VSKPKYVYKATAKAMIDDKEQTFFIGIFTDRGNAKAAIEDAFNKSCPNWKGDNSCSYWPGPDVSFIFWDGSVRMFYWGSVDRIRLDKSYVNKLKRFYEPIPV
jgi:hypothetical protein